MGKQIDKLEHAFANAGTANPHGRAQRMVDRKAGVDQAAVMDKIPRSKIRKHRPGAHQRAGTLPRVP